MIDVMFFLLATFMLASLALQNLHSLAVNLPRGEARLLQPTHPITLTVTRAGEVLLDEAAVSLDALPGMLRARAVRPDTQIIVAADHAAPSGLVVQTMLKARQVGAEHFLFAVTPR